MGLSNEQLRIIQAVEVRATGDQTVEQARNLTAASIVERFRLEGLRPLPSVDEVLAAMPALAPADPFADDSGAARLIDIAVLLGKALREAWRRDGAKGYARAMEGLTELDQHALAALASAYSGALEDSERRRHRRLRPWLWRWAWPPWAG
jgi:hypothetical protein